MRRHYLFLIGQILFQALATAAGDLSKISRSWGSLSSYADNAEDAFGVQYVGLPDGCQVESVHTLQRHAQRFPEGNDITTTSGFARKVANFTRANRGKAFLGPLAFLNTNVYVLKDTGLLTGYGAATVFSAGVSFWARYGRTLYNASGSGLAYDSVFVNGTARPKITLRTTGQSRIWNSQINWALGFFGPSFNATPDPYLTAWNGPFNVTIIPEGGTENNTLASYDSCFNDNLAANGYNAAQYQDRYKKIYLRSAVYRLQKFAPAGFSFDYKDLYAMQTTCAYEYAFIGASAYCDIFTDEEWAGFENIQDMKFYFLYSFGNPTGRAQGIGYVQELLARIKHEYITLSDSSVNATLDQNADNFPVNQQIYADFSHDDIIISALTALSIDYFKDPPTLTKFPPSANNHFTLSHLVPFGANLITEIIGCGSASPEPVEQRRIFYTPSQYGYDAANARYKFIRMRLNNAILPLSTIRGGKCGDLTSGRLDGLCELPKFLESQQDSYSLSNYDYACFGNYTLPNATEAIDYDGAIFQGKDYAQCM